MLADVRTWKDDHREAAEAAAAVAAEAARRIQAREDFRRYHADYYRRNEWRWAGYRLKYSLSQNPDTPMLQDAWTFSPLHEDMASDQLDPAQLMMLQEEEQEQIS